MQGLPHNLGVVNATASHHANGDRHVVSDAFQTETGVTFADRLADQRRTERERRRRALAKARGGRGSESSSSHGGGALLHTHKAGRPETSSTVAIGWRSVPPHPRQNRIVKVKAPSQVGSSSGSAKARKLEREAGGGHVRLGFLRALRRPLVWLLLASILLVWLLAMAQGWFTNGAGFLALLRARTRSGANAAAATAATDGEPPNIHLLPRRQQQAHIRQRIERARQKAKEARTEANRRRNAATAAATEQT